MPIGLPIDLPIGSPIDLPKGLSFVILASVILPPRNCCAFKLRVGHLGRIDYYVSIFKLGIVTDEGLLLLLWSSPLVY